MKQIKIVWCLSTINVSYIYKLTLILDLIIYSILPV